MAKRRSKKTAISKRKKLAKSTKSDSTVSLSGRHRAYRWRYLQLIKEGLVWLTGKRTRGVRTSESAIAASKKSPKRRSQRKATRAASPLRFKVVRGMFEEGGKKKKKHAGKRTAQRKRGPKGMRMHGNARSNKAVSFKRGYQNNTTKRGRKPTRGRPKKPQKSDSESTYETVIFDPKKHRYARSSKCKGPKSKSRQGTAKSGRRQGANKSNPKRARGTKMANFSGGPRADRIVTRSVSSKVLPRNQSPKKTASPGKGPGKMVTPGRSHVKMVTPCRDASGSTIFV